jgi:hypothetical protein
MDKNIIAESARETLMNALSRMEKGGKYGPYHTMMVSMSDDEVRYLLDLAVKKRIKLLLDENGHITPLAEEQDDFETGFMAGFEHGRQMTLKDIIKMLGRMKWHGGGYKEERAAGVPEHHAGRAADHEPAVQRKRSGAGHGRTVRPGAAED